MEQDHSKTPVTTVLICSEQDRYVPWARVLLEAGANRVYVKCTGGIGFCIDKENLDDKGSLVVWNQIPKTATAVLVHSGDGHLWERDVKARTVFWFDSPGSPTVSGGDIAILRPTSSLNFEITETDAKEIIDYCIGKKRELPSCCTPKQTSNYLHALAILCQGYLAVHARFDAGKWGPEKISTALDQMGWVKFIESDPFEEKELILTNLEKRAPEVIKAQWWSSIFELQPIKPGEKNDFRWAQFEANIINEWDESKNGKVPASLMVGLINNIKYGHEMRGEVTLKDGRTLSVLRAVADAYCAIVKRLGA